MTLAIGIVVGDGIAIAADSRTTLQGSEPQWRVLSDFTHKVFRVENVAIATYGYAFLSGRNIAGHMAEFSQRFPSGQDLSAESVAGNLHDFFGERFEKHVAETKEAPIPEGAIALGFLVGGYDSGVGCLHEVAVPAKTVTKLTDSTTGGGAWRGQTDVVVRLIKGADLTLLERYAAADGHAAEHAALKDQLAKMEYSIPFGQLNLQDAVDLASLLVKTTIDIQRLTHGTIGSLGSWPGVGGPIEIATVTAAGGFRWAQRTHIRAERPSGLAEQSRPEL
jgi:hypothetical protein